MGVARRLVGPVGAAWALAGVALGACADDEGATRCVPGQASACACTSGASGAQTCRADFTFDPCVCAGDDAVGGGSSLAGFELTSIATWGRANGFGGWGSERDDFWYPSGIGLSPDERELYVVDSENHRIKVLDVDDGATLRMWPHEDIVSCGSVASGLAVGADGTVYVPFATNHGIIAYSPSPSRISIGCWRRRTAGS